MVVDKDASGLERLKQALGSSVVTIHANLKDIDDDLIRKIKHPIPADEGVKFLIHNAAETDSSVFGQITRPLADRLFTVNVTAPLLLTQALSAQMSKVKGRILHLGTNCAHRTQQGLTVYGLSKAAFYRTTHQLRPDLGPLGILTTSCIPGMTDTVSFWEGHEEAKRHDLPFYHIIEKVLQSGVKPSSPAYVAKFLGYILLETRDDEYETQEWDIHNKELRAKWDL